MSAIPASAILPIDVTKGFDLDSKVKTPVVGTHAGDAGLTDSQLVGYFVKYANSQLAGKTWADAMTIIRSTFGVKGGAHDFMAIDGIKRFFSRNPLNDVLSEAQEDLLDTNWKALSGAETHWWAPIASRIASSDRETVVDVKRLFAGADACEGVNRVKAFNLAMRHFNMEFGEVPSREERAKTTVTVVQTKQVENG